MSTRIRLVFFSALTVATASACNALLGISDLPDPGASDAAHVDAPVGVDVAPEAASDADASCSAAGDPNPCIFVEPQTGGAIFPTWPITSDLSVAESAGFSEPIRPTYLGDDAGAVVESHSTLTWQTAYRHGGGGEDTFDFAAATTACQALGKDWRLPTRIELATTQYRGAPLTGDLRTTCVPPEFDPSLHVIAWTTTSVPAAVGESGMVYVAHETECGFTAAPKSSKQWARCVKGATKPATFVVHKAKDEVHAVDTGLLWERTGVVVRTYAEAKAHCDVRGQRIPVIQELYGIIDTRTVALFHPTLFVAPVLDAGAAKSILSQTVYAIDADGGAPTYETISVGSPWADENGTGATSQGLPDIFVRCVSTFIPSGR